MEREGARRFLGAAAQRAERRPDQGAHDDPRSMREQEGRKESLFRQSVEAEKNKADLLEKKFQEAVRKAKETPDTGKPLRDFDLD